MIRALCLDCGASSTKWTTLMGDKVLKSGSADYITGHIFTENEWTRVGNTLNEIKASIGNVEQVVLGVTGLDASIEVSQKLRVMASSIFETSSVLVMNDMQLAYSAFLSPGEGILIYGGTGSVAASIDLNGNFHRTGGWGFMIADEGGGFWIGQQVLRHLTDGWDLGDFDWNDPLTSLAMIQAGSRNWNDLRAFVYGGGRHAVASLAPVVAEAMNRGSEVAAEILKGAGIELGKLALVLQARLKTKKFVAHGGVFKIHNLIFESLMQHVNQKIELVDGDIAEHWIKKNLINIDRTSFQD